MTAQVFTAVVRPATGWSPERKKGGSAAVDGATAFAAVTDVRGALAVCSEAWKAEHVVGPNRIGKATSVLS
jgi:hypothetical protein